MTTRRLTPHRLETLRAVLAHGGAWADDGHMGRLSKRRPFRTWTLRNLEERGLLEAIQVEDPARQKFAGSTLLERPTCSTRYFVTAKGCRAVAAAGEAKANG